MKPDPIRIRDEIGHALMIAQRYVESAKNRARGDAYDAAKRDLETIEDGLRAHEHLRDMMRNEPTCSTTEREAPSVCECSATQHPPCSFCENMDPDERADET